jgi:polyisoprenoid-binding protein YceI
MKKVMLLGFAAIAMLVASCGGGESADGTGTDTTKKDTTPVVTTTTYAVDTTATVINWKAYGKLDHADSAGNHWGTVNALSGTVTATDSAGTWTLASGDVAINMNSVKEGQGAVDLEGHLKAPEFFDVNQFASSNFVFSGFDGTNITGTLTVTGKTVEINTPATVTITPEAVTVEVAPFIIDFLALGMPYYVEDAKQKPAKQHDPKVEISATVVANKVAQ